MYPQKISRAMKMDPSPPVCRPTTMCRRKKIDTTSREIGNRKGHSSNQREGGGGDGDGDGGVLLFDSSSAVGSGRWPCVEASIVSGTGGGGRSVSPPRSVSPLGGPTSPKAARERGARGLISSPKSVDGGASMRPGPSWGGGAKPSTSAGR